MNASLVITATPEAFNTCRKQLCKLVPVGASSVVQRIQNNLSQCIISKAMRTLGVPSTVCSTDASLTSAHVTFFCGHSRDSIVPPCVPFSFPASHSQLGPEHSPFTRLYFPTPELTSASSHRATCPYLMAVFSQTLAHPCFWCDHANIRPNNLLCVNGLIRS